MTISRKELLEAAECETPILNHLDELTEDAMKAIFFERIPTCEGSNSTKPLISPSKERVLTEKMGRNEYVIYKGVCCRCGETVEFKLRKTDIVTHTFPFFQNIIESKEKYGKVDLSCHESSKYTRAIFVTRTPYQKRRSKNMVRDLSQQIN